MNRGVVYLYSKLKIFTRTRACEIPLKDFLHVDLWRVQRRRFNMSFFLDNYDIIFHLITLLIVHLYDLYLIHKPYICIFKYVILNKSYLR